VDLPIDNDISGICDMSFTKSMEFATKARPKAIRVPISQLHIVKYAAAFSTRDRHLNKGWIFFMGLGNNFKE
jgi:hypothetical protein